MSTPLATMIREMAAAGCSIEIIAQTVELAETHARSVTPLRSSNALRQANYRERKRNVVNNNVTNAGGTIGGETSLSEEKEEKQTPIRVERNAEADEWFEEIWEEYPKRQGHSNPKKPARARFKSLLKSGVKPEDIAKGVIQLKANCQKNQTEPRFIPQLITWLNQERWNDGEADAGSQDNRSRNYG